MPSWRSHEGIFLHLTPPACCEHTYTNNEVWWSVSRRYIVPAEARFLEVARQIRNLVGCDTVHLLLGCPEPALRHPLLKRFSPNDYLSASSSNAVTLLQHERVRALCDGAIQTGQLQSIDQAHIFAGSTEVQSIALVTLERPAGVLGLLLLADSRPNAFYHGECLLLRHFLPQVALKL